MTIEREIPTAIRQDIEAQATPYIPLGFLTITHDNLVTPIRVVSDTMDYVYESNNYDGVLFGFSIVTDNEESPRAELRLSNVNKKLSKAIRKISGRAKMSLVVLSSRDFNLSVDPRVATGTPDIMYQFDEFELEKISVNAGQVSGSLAIRDFSRESWPSIYATRSRLPGLYR